MVNRINNYPHFEGRIKLEDEVINFRVSMPEFDRLFQLVTTGKTDMF